MAATVKERAAIVGKARDDALDDAAAAVEKMRVSKRDPGLLGALGISGRRRTHNAALDAVLEELKRLR